LIIGNRPGDTARSRGCLLVLPLDFKCRDTRAAAPASARTHVSGIDDGDGLDLDHEIGSGETGDADGSGLAARSQPAPGGPSLS